MNTATSSAPLRGTIILVSGEYDKALAAFDIAIGQASMGMEVHMWFMLYGVNCIKKPRPPRSWFAPHNQDTAGRQPNTDTPWQHVLNILNRGGANRLPLSQLNFFGIGPWLMRQIMRRKGLAPLEQLIEAAVQLGVQFKVCQVCVDLMSIDMTEDLVVKAEVLGVSSYALDTQQSHYNVVI